MDNLDIISTLSYRMWNRCVSSESIVSFGRRRGLGDDKHRNHAKSTVQNNTWLSSAKIWLQTPSACAHSSTMHAHARTHLHSKAIVSALEHSFFRGRCLRTPLPVACWRL